MLCKGSPSPRYFCSEMLLTSSDTAPGLYQGKLVLRSWVSVCVWVRVSVGRGERGRNSHLKKLRERGDKKEISCLISFSVNRLRKIKQFIESLPIQWSIYQHSPKRSLAWLRRFFSSDSTWKGQGCPEKQSWRQDLSCAFAWGVFMGTLCPSSLVKWVFAVLQDFTVAFCLVYNLMVRPGEMQLFYDQWDNGCDVGLYRGVAEAGLEPAPLVVALGLWAVRRNFMRQNLFMQVSLVLFIPRLHGAFLSPCLALSPFIHGTRQDLALTHLLHASVSRQPFF